MRFVEWLLSGEAARAERHPHNLAAFYWNGGTATAAVVRDISESGAFVMAPEHWYPGTILTVTLQTQADGDETKPPETITVLCKVVRQDENGMGVEFLFAGSRDKRAMRRFIERVAPDRAVSANRPQGGQTLIEFALTVPLLFLLIFSAVNLGGFLYSWITVANAARAGVQNAAMGTAYASLPAQASAAAISTLIQNETVSLPGTTPVVRVCQTLNGAWINYPQAATNTTCSITPALTASQQDPETITGVAGASKYTVVVVDVSYTYAPLVGSFSTRYLGTPSAPGTVHRQTFMRLLN